MCKQQIWKHLNAASILVESYHVSFMHALNFMYTPRLFTELMLE